MAEKPGQTWSLYRKPCPFLHSLLSQYLGSMLCTKGPTEMLWLLLNLHPCAGEATPCPPGLREAELTWGEEGALV